MEEAKILLAEIIKDIAKSAASSLVKKAKDYLVDMSKKEEIDVGDAYEVYLRKVYDTYSKSKSVIYINEARELRKFFVPSNLMYEKNMPVQGRISLKKSGSYTLSGKIINCVFEKSNKIIITGIGGLGKTMHMKHFCISAIEQGFKIPIFIPLRWFNERNMDEEPLEKLIYDRLEEFGFKLDYKYFKYSLDSDKYVFLLDGYDEVSKAKINQVSNHIQSFSHRYSDNSFIISSRDIDNIYGWDDYIVYSLCPLKYSDAVQLIWKLDFAEDMKKGFIDDLRKGMYEKYESIASVPLLLSIMYMTYVDNTTFPDSLEDFYDKAFETMLYGHDRRQKIGFQREFTSGLGYTDFKEVFRAFCFRSYFNDEYSFTENALIRNIKEVKGISETPFDAHAYKEDLVNITCMLISEGFEYVFIHRSFQEYYAASFVSKMLEDEQEEFCSDYINNAEYEDDTKYITFHGVLNLDNKGNNKTIDFLKMLKNIDPKTFEHVVLQPILKKIYNRYIECGKNLIITAFSYWYINNVIKSFSTYHCEVGFRQSKNKDDQFTFEEYLVLCFFYHDFLQQELLGSRIEKISRLLNDNIDLIMDLLKYGDIEKFDRLVEVRYYLTSNNDSTLSPLSPYYSDELIHDLLLFFDYVINKYEVLNEKNSVKISFKDRVNNPEYYKH